MNQSFTAHSFYSIVSKSEENSFSPNDLMLLVTDVPHEAHQYLLSDLLLV